MDNNYKNIRSIQNPNQCLRWWLVHSFLYYRVGTSIISDADFDTLTSWLKSAWHAITSEHKNLVTLEDLNAGSGFAIQFPLIVENSAYLLLRFHQEQISVPKSIAKKGKTPTVQTITAAPRHDTLFDT